MATFRETTTSRILLAILKRRQGGRPNLQNVRRIEQLLRFAGVFAVTILLPALLLAYFALASIRSEELSLDADLRARAAAVETQVQQDLANVFERFERLARQRVQGGGSPIEQIGELSSTLRLAVRVDSKGQLVAPFAPPEGDVILPDPAVFRRPWRAGVAAAWSKDWNTAAARFAEAKASATDERLAGEAAFAEARARIELGADPAALLNEVYSDYATVRDRTGFRIGDLIVLTQAELRLADAPDAAAAILQDLVTTLTNRRWVLGQASEATIARKALDLLPPTYEPTWQARARTLLTTRTIQLRWAEEVAGELELLATSVKVPEGRFRYIAGPDSTTLWAASTLGGQPYVFAFDLVAILEQLEATAARGTANDTDLIARLTSNPTSPGAVVRRSLGPYLQFITLSVEPRDPEALTSLKANRRRVRIMVVVLAVVLVMFGVLLTARIVGRELENARMKTDFAANVSHELRSPITQIRLKAETLQLDLCRDDDDRQHHYDAIVNESERLSRLVDNVLDFAAIERGAKSYSLRPDDLVEVVMLQTEAARGLIEERNLTFHVDVPDDLPPVWMDREAIGQVLTNLLSNAAKYGADGGWVGVRVEAGPKGVELAVSDRGLGISTEELPQVFDNFFRSTDPLVRRKKGTGIGLAIVRYIVEAHGATITVDSEPGEGTTFTILFPTQSPLDPVS